MAGAKADRFPCEKKYRIAAIEVANVPPAIPVEDEVADSTTDETPLTQHAVSTVAFNRRKVRLKLLGLVTSTRPFAYCCWHACCVAEALWHH